MAAFNPTSGTFPHFGMTTLFCTQVGLTRNHSCSMGRRCSWFLCESSTLFLAGQLMIPCCRLAGCVATYDMCSSVSLNPSFSRFSSELLLRGFTLSFPRTARFSYDVSREPLWLFQRKSALLQSCSLFGMPTYVEYPWINDYARNQGGTQSDERIFS